MKHTQGVQRAIETLAAEQFGVFGRDQAIELGATRRAIEHRVATGAWVRALPGVYRIPAVAPSDRQMATAVSLWSLPDGLVSDSTAAVLWGFEGVAADGVHVMVPPDRHLRAEGITVHRRRDFLPADASSCGPIRVTSPLRTAVDLARVMEVDALEIAIESALRRRLFSPGQLRWRANALMGTGRDGSAALRSLLESRELGRSESGWEVRVGQLLAAAGLGPPRRQYEVRSAGRLIARADLAYPDVRLIIEYDSDAWHSGVARRHRDAERRNELRAHGWTVYEVTASQLRDPHRVVEHVRLLLAA